MSQEERASSWCCDQKESQYPFNVGQVVSPFFRNSSFQFNLGALSLLNFVSLVDFLVLLRAVKDYTMNKWR